MTTKTSEGLAPERADSPPPPPTTRTWSALWPLLARLHFYAGVCVAPFLVVAAFTGLLYTAVPQLDRLIYGDELRIERVIGDTKPLAEQVDAARNAHPDGTIASVAPPAGPEDTTRVVFNVPELGEKQRTVYVDPYTNEVRGELTTWFGSTPVTTWLDDLHRNLHLGDLGRMYSELAASWLWVIALGGVLLWFGRRRQYRGSKPLRAALAPDLSAQGVRRTRGWHASIGVWLSVGLLLLSATGLTWSKYTGGHFTTLRGELNATAPVLPTALPGAEAAPGGEPSHHEGGPTAGAEGTDLPAGVSIDRVLTSARAAGLRGPVEITPPADAQSTWTVAQSDNVWPVRYDQAAIDPASGKVTAATRWSDHPVLAKLSKLGVQAHMGVLFGLVNQVLLALLAIGLLCVIFWGYRMWWQRRPTRDAARGLGKAPVRGSWRRLPLPVLIVGIPLVIAIGWAMPLLGITLLGFVLLDVAIGYLDRPSAT